MCDVLTQVMLSPPTSCALASSARSSRPTAPKQVTIRGVHPAMEHLAKGVAGGDEA